MHKYININLATTLTLKKVVPNKLLMFTLTTIISPVIITLIYAFNFFNINLREQI